MTVGSFTPLAPELYQALARAFGEVRVANEGEEIEVSFELDTRPGSRRLLGRGAAPEGGLRLRERHRRGEYYRVACPFCGDARFRLWVSYRWGDMPSLAWCYNDDACMAKPANQMALRWMILGNGGGLRAPVLRGKPVAKEVGGIRPPGPVVPLRQLPDDHPCVRYLLGRGYDPDQLSDRYGVGCCASVDDPAHRTLVGRIYVPVNQDGRLVGWQGRYPADLDWKACGLAKYYTLPGLQTGRVLYGYDEARAFEDVVLVEGVADRWSLGPQALATFGCRLKPGQRLRMLEWRNRGAVAVMFDGEAREDADAAVDSLSSMFPQRVFRVDLPRGVDPGGLATEAAWAAVLASAEAGKVPFRRSCS